MLSKTVSSDLRFICFLCFQMLYELIRKHLLISGDRDSDMLWKQLSNILTDPAVYRLVRKLSWLSFAVS
jgi:hypothetical protein